MAPYRQAVSWTTCRGTTTVLEGKVEVTDYEQAFGKNVMPLGGTSIGDDIERMIEEEANERLVEEETEPVKEVLRRHIRDRGEDWPRGARYSMLRRVVKNSMVDADLRWVSLKEAHIALDEMERRYKDAYREGHEAGYNEALLEAATHQGITDEANNESCTIRDMLGLISAHAQDCGVSAMVSVCLDELDVMRDRAYENGYNDGRRDERLEATND